MSDIHTEACQWLDGKTPDLLDWHDRIFDFGETAWREYRSAEWYVNRLREEGFEVETGSGGMPTAFCATWNNGTGPTIASYAEYDAVPGNCQAADTTQRPRDGLSPHAGGHTDPHSALGMSTLGALLCAKQMMQRHNIPGRLKYMGEPAEKVRGSKPIHAANGYYDDIDAAISFHPFYMLPLCNTTRWNTHCGAAYGMIYSFECEQPESWLSQQEESESPIAAAHASARAPGANDALVTMYQTSKALREHMVSAGCGWSMSECILTAGQATADNLPARLAQIQYLIRVPDIAMAERITRVLDQNAAAAASIAHCSWRKDWVCKSRHGLANHTLARATFNNLKEVGAPTFNQGAALEVGRDVQKSLGLTPMQRPFLDMTEQLIDPETAEQELRQMLPDWQEHFTSDDYTEYCWHAPTVRLYIARPTLAAPQPGYRYPDWAMNALGGIRETIEPMIRCASKTVALTLLDLLTDNKLLSDAKSEFLTRTGGIGGKHWQPPLCDYAAPIHFKWPEYISTERGFEWCIPG